MVDYRFYKSVLLINPSPDSNNINDISNLIDEIKPDSHVIIWQPWEAHDERFVKYLIQDYNIYPNHSEDFQNFEDVLVKNNVKCYLLVGCDYSDAYVNIKTNPLKNFDVLFWPTSLLHYTFYGMKNFYGMEPSKLFNRYRPIDKLYLNLNHHERHHRALLLDYLCKFELFDYGINTWKDSESLFKIIFYTEKTFKSILFGKLFLVFGAKGQNMNLHKYGFGLYSIFDYEFDKSNLISSRCLGIIDNLYTIKNKDFGKVRDEMIGLSMSNIDTATAIVYNDEYIPRDLKTIIQENKEEYKLILSDFNGNYNGSFGMPDDFKFSENIFKEIYQ
jgi:hypothetical protein